MFIRGIAVSIPCSHELALQNLSANQVQMPGLGRTTNQSFGRKRVRSSIGEFD